MICSHKSPGCRRHRAQERLPEMAALDTVDIFDSYHSHHRLLGESESVRRSSLSSYKSSIPSCDRHSARHSCEHPLSSKSVVFSPNLVTVTPSASPLPEPTRKRNQSPPLRCKPLLTEPSQLERTVRTDNKEKTVFKRREREAKCSSKSVQTSNSLMNLVSRRSIGVGVSACHDIYFGAPWERRLSTGMHHRCSRSISPSPSSPGRGRDAFSRASASTINGFPFPGGFPYSRTASTVLAALEAPPASYRHCRCMASANYYRPSLPKTPSNFKKKSKTAGKPKIKRYKPRGKNDKKM